MSVKEAIVRIGRAIEGALLSNKDIQSVGLHRVSRILDTGDCDHILFSPLEGAPRSFYITVPKGSSNYRIGQQVEIVSGVLRVPSFDPFDSGRIQIASPLVRFFTRRRDNEGEVLDLRSLGEQVHPFYPEQAQ